MRSCVDHPADLKRNFTTAPNQIKVKAGNFKSLRENERSVRGVRLDNWSYAYGAFLSTDGFSFQPSLKFFVVRAVKSIVRAINLIFRAKKTTHKPGHDSELQQVKGLQFDSSAVLGIPLAVIIVYSGPEWWRLIKLRQYFIK